MPTYEYACRDCGEHVEVVQSFKDAPLETCGACGGALRKVFSAAGIIFKGSGYYVTDTRGKRGSSAESSSSTPSSSPKSSPPASSPSESGSSSSSSGSGSSSSSTKAAESA